MKSTVVTVYIPCRNYGRFLSHAIDSVITQSFLDWELFLVDEASDDDTLDIMSKYAALYPDQIRVIVHESPHGLQRTANEILSLARGRYFIRLDADDWFDEAALLILVTALDDDDRLGIAWGNYYYTDINGNILGVEQSNKPGSKRVVTIRPPHGACTMVRTRILKAVGGYSEDVDAQDGWELWYKIFNLVDATSVSTPLFYYRQHQNSMSQNSVRLLSARTKIFEKLALQQNGSYEPSVLAVIGVRENYPGNQGVPYQKINGISLLEHCLKTTLSASRVTDVLVSSKSQRVLNFSQSLEDSGAVGSHLRHQREINDRSDGLPIQEILSDAGNYYHEIKGCYPDIIVFCNLHSINRTAIHLDTALNVLRIKCCDSVVSTQDERDVLFAIGKNGLKMVNPGRLIGLSFERERLFRFNGAMIATWWNVLDSGSLLGEKIGFIEMTSSESLKMIQVPERLAQGFTS